MSRRPCKKAQKMAMVRLWYVQGASQRPALAAPNPKRAIKAPKAGWGKADLGDEFK